MEKRNNSKTILIRLLLVLLLCGAGVLLGMLPSLVYRFRSSQSPSPYPPEADSEYAQVYQVLSGIQDPEIDLSLVELGLIRKVEISEHGKVTVTTILTSPYCPFSGVIVKQIKTQLGESLGIDQVEVIIDHRAVWSEDLMTAEARSKLRDFWK